MISPPGWDSRLGCIAIFQLPYHSPYCITQRLQVVHADIENLFGINNEVLVCKDVTHTLDTMPVNVRIVCKDTIDFSSEIAMPL